MSQKLPKYCESMKKEYLKCLNDVSKCDEEVEYKKSLCLLKYINSVKYIKQCNKKFDILAHITVF